MPIGSLVTVKIACALAKDMVNFEAATRLAPNLIYYSRRWFLDAIANQQQTQIEQQADSTNGGKDSNNQDSVSTEYLVHNWLEALFAWFQIVILWHEPSVSLGAVSGLLSSFLLLTYFAPRFYASILIVIFVFNLYKFWFRHVWPEIRVPPGRDRENELRLDVDRFTYLHPQLMTLAELNQHTTNLMKLGEKYLKDLLEIRRQKPVGFCSLLCSILISTAIIGNHISGMCLLFMAFTAIMTGPGIYVHLLPDDCKKYLRDNIGRILSSAAANEAFNDETIKHEGRQAEEPVSADSTSGLATQPRAPQAFIASSISTTTKSIEQLFETLRKKSFSSNQAGQTTSKATSEEDDDDDVNERTKLIDIPLSTSENRRNFDARLRSRHNPSHRNSDSSEGNEESVSLLESDDDQQDGFVML